MDYKKIIKNQKLRFKILELLSFIPDKTMLKLQYRIKTGRKLNIKNPKRYTEKIQWYKLYYRNPLMTKCADKYTVREYVKSKGLENILNEVYGVYDSVDEIDFEKLPNEFVLKTTNDSHTNIFCEDKENINAEEVKKELNNYINNRPKKPVGREWAYNNAKRKIICEKFLKQGNNENIKNYKFLCFSGKPYYLYVVEYDKDKVNQAIYDINGNKTKYADLDLEVIDKEIKLPENFNEMVRISQILSEDFPHVRVDLYDINEKIIFGELTFYDRSGYGRYIPDEFDFILGEKFEIEKIKEQDNE